MFLKRPSVRKKIRLRIRYVKEITVPFTVIKVCLLSYIPFEIVVDVVTKLPIRQ